MSGFIIRVSDRLLSPGFMQFVAQPLFMAWHQFMQTPLTAKMLGHLAANQANWKAIMSEVGVPKKTSRGLAVEDASDDDNDSYDSDVDYEFLDEEELEHAGEERMDVVDMAKDDEDVEEEPMDIKKYKYSDWLQASQPSTQKGGQRMKLQLLPTPQKP